MEQYLDFLGNRTFRRTLFCHKEAAVNRNQRPAVVGQFQLASQTRLLSDEPDVRQVSVEKFSGSDGAIFATDHPLSKAAMLILARQ